MNPLDVLTTAITSLSANKMRASLTLLGIVIGVTAVIVLVSMGRGVQNSITSEFESLGANLLTVTPGSSEGGFGAFFGGGEYGADESNLTLEDAYALRDSEYAPSVVGVAPEITLWAPVVFNSQVEDWTQITGVTPEYRSVRNYTVASGDFISYKHVEDAASVTVIGASVSESLFGFRNPVGQTVKLNDRPFTIIGVLEKREGLFGELDQRLLIPITTAHHRIDPRRTERGEIRVDTINAQAASSEATESAKDEMSAVLRLRHRVTDRDDFTISTQQDAIEAIQSATGVIVVFLGSIAGISLLVGGIGIMNIMLVTVTERTREIGIRKAMGAKRRDVLFQFMAEASMLSFTGGLVGLALAYGIVSLISGQPIFGPDSEIAITVTPDIAMLACRRIHRHRAILRHIPGDSSLSPPPNRGAQIRMTASKSLSLRTLRLAYLNKTEPKFRN